MPVEIFTQEQFETALSAYKFKSLGYVAGELTYAIELDSKVSIEIRSTIWRDGQSAASGDDSIRMWLTSNADKRPLGKLDKYTTRVADWEKRVQEKIEQLKELRKVAGDCPSCQQPVSCFITGPNSKNEGRIYAKCMSENKWLKFVDVKTDGVPFKDKVKRGSALDALNASEPVRQNNTNFKPSPQQKIIGEFVQNQKGNLRITAYAGTGKTTALVYLSNLLPSNLTVKAMVFAKRNAVDMQSKLPEFVIATTAHSAAFADIRRVTPRVKVDDPRSPRKMWDLFNAYIRTLRANDKDATADELQASASEILRLVSLCKNTLSEPTDANLDQLAAHFGVMLNGTQVEAYECAKTLYEQSLAQSNVLIDFDDMILLPALGRFRIKGETQDRIYPVQQCDLLLVDEQQDTNRAQQVYYLKVAKRIIFVGDPHQSIYGFRGADIDAMERMTQETNAVELPLSVCYRCSKSVVREAQTIVPQIEYAESAVEGSVSTIKESELLTKVKPGDMVLCRLNAPLVAPAFELIRNGVKAVILGKDIGKGLIVLLRKVQRRYGIDGAELNLVLSKLAEYGALESLKLRSARKENQALILEDQVETIMALSDGVSTARAIEERIEKVFSDEVTGIPFSSVHKAKGLEAPNVYILHPELMPFPKAKEEWQKMQEKNLLYVAITRAKENLFWVTPA